MNILSKTLLAVSLGSLMSVGAQAAIYDGNYTGTPYIGVKVGQVSVDDEGTRSIDDPTTYGVYGGYNFDPNFGVELEYMGSDDADFTDSDGDQGEYDVKNYGAYGTYRYYFTNSPLYVKGKLGVARTEISADYNINDYDDSDDETAVAGGVALGYAISPEIGIEAEYAMTGGDHEVRGATIGAHFKF